jgi:protocadherin Fat 4
MDKNDSPPTFRDLPSSYMVSEDLGTGQLVATIKASDPDTIGKLEYSLISGDDGKFLLDKADGTLKLRDTLDRETKDLYKLVIRVTDGVQYTETTITVQVSKVKLYMSRVKERQKTQHENVIQYCRSSSLKMCIRIL